MGEDIPMADMTYPEGGNHAPPPGGVRIFPPAAGVKPGEPLYAQVNREKKKNRSVVEGVGVPGGGELWGYDEGVGTLAKGIVVDGHGHVSAPPPGGDSWV